MRVLLDTGAECSWLPAEVLASVGIHRRRKKAFTSADGRSIVRDVGYCILAAEGFETADEIVFGEPGDMCLLGVRTLEGFGVSVDPVAHRLVERPLIVAGNIASGVWAADKKLKSAGSGEPVFDVAGAWLLCAPSVSHPACYARRLCRTGARFGARRATPARPERWPVRPPLRDSRLCLRTDIRSITCALRRDSFEGFSFGVST